MTMPQIRKATPVLIVDAIEPCLPLWQERLGFVILGNGTVEVMYQSADSLRADSPAHGAAFGRDKTFLFVEVDDIDALAAALQGFEIVMPRRETFYGSTEIGYREPGGHYITFAQMRR